MARMPTRDDLPQAVAQANTTIVRGPQDSISGALQGLSGQLANTATVMARNVDADRKKQAALDTARATAFLNQGLMETRSNYNVQNKPDVTQWSGDYQKGTSKLLDAATKQISDPEAREMFRLKASDDVTRYNINVTEEAQKITNERQLATASFAMDEIANLAAATDNPEETARLMARLQEAGQVLVKSNIVTPEAMATKTLAYRREIAKQQAIRRATLHPTEVYGVLTGDRFRSYNSKLIGSESSGRPDARPRGKDGELLSSALGYGQFIHETWERIRKDHPDLELDPSYGKTDNPNDGRRNYEQNIKALGVLAKENAAMLAKNGVPVTEANLKLAHVMGTKAVDMLMADSGALASAVFPAEAEANPDLFKGRTVGEVISRLTRQFNSQPQDPMPEFGDWLAPGDRNSVLRMAQSASESERNKWETDFKQQQLIDARESAMEFPTEEEALAHLDTMDLPPDVRLDAERLVSGEFVRKARQDEAARKVEYDQVLKAIQDGQMNGASEAELLEMTKGMKDQGNRKVFNDFILQGPPKRNDPQLMNRIDNMRYSHDAAVQKQFRELDLTSPEMLTGLTSEMRGQLFAQQEASAKRAGPSGKDPVFTTVSDMRGSLAASMGLVVSGAKADPEDVAVMDMISQQIQTALEQAYAQKGDTLSNAEMQQIAQGAVIQWYNSTKINDGIFKDTESNAGRAVSVAYENLKDAGETQPLPVLWRQYNAAVDAAEKASGKAYERSPSSFARWMQNQANSR